jgi:hypothetical protein
MGLIHLGQIPGAAPVAAFNPPMTESLINTKGLQALHYKHAPNPDRETLAGGVNPNSVAAKWGWIYYDVRQLRLVPQQFKLEDRLQVQGIWGMGSVLLNVAGHYFDCGQEHVFMRPWDLVVIQAAADGSPITTQTDQFAEYNPNGPMRLNFQVLGVDLLRGKNRTFLQGEDFCVQNGLIHWLPNGHKPAFHDGKGEILSIVYWIKPTYIVQNVPHAIRITPGNDTGDANQPREARYAPQLVVAKQAWFHDDAASPLDFTALPDYNYPRDSKNVTGGS